MIPQALLREGRIESARAAGRALIRRGKPAIAVIGLGSGLESAAAIVETLTRQAA